LAGIPTGIAPKSTDFSIKEHFASLTTPMHLTSTLAPSSILRIISSSSVLVARGLNVTFTYLNDPAGTSSMAGSGIKVPD
jgi:hypothetical protein